MFALAVTTFAGEDDGNRLLKECSAAVATMDKTVTSADLTHATTLNAGVCIGTIQSFAATLMVLEGAGVEVSAKTNICLPPPTPERSGVKTEQGIRIVEKYLRDHPERLHEPRIVLLFAAFRQAFPCKASTP